VAGAYGVDQTILGQSFLAKDPGQPARRKVLVKAKEPASSNTIVGNPTADGATLTVTANGGTPSTQTFDLPASNWSGDVARGFKYKGASGFAGAVKLVKLKVAPNGKLSLKALATGKSGTVNVVPPDPGTDACALLAIDGGDSYSRALRSRQPDHEQGRTALPCEAAGERRLVHPGDEHDHDADHIVHVLDQLDDALRIAEPCLHGAGDEPARLRLRK
jgi:hypothetical protein